MIWVATAWAESVDVIHGFAADGTFVYEVTASEDVVVPDQDESETASRRYVVAASPGGGSTRWLVGERLPVVRRPDGTLREVVPADPIELAAWQTWRDAHPLTAATHAVSGAGGVQLGVAGHEPEGGGFSLGADPTDELRVPYGLSNRGDGEFPLGTLEVEGNNWSSRWGRVDAYWSADGRWAAIVVNHEDTWTMRGILPGKLGVSVIRPVLIGVLAPGGTPVDAVVRAARPFGVVATGPAKQARDRTVVYYADGFADVATGLAAAVPGGATTAKMDWTGPQHVVVAVGASAR